MGFVCQTFRRELDTRRGLGVHHSRVHGERIPNLSCANCGESFYDAYAKKYCSKACLREDVPFRGEANPNLERGIVTTECEICGSPLEYAPSEKAGGYCPTASWMNRAHAPRDRGSDHPRWSGGMVERECNVSGDAVERYPSGFVSDFVVCSESCRRVWLSEASTGEGHQNRRGGGNESYGSGWNLLREKAQERDGFERAVNGKSRDEIGRNPDVHHVVPVRWFAESKEHDREDAHELENVISFGVDSHRNPISGRSRPGGCGNW